jgi:superfamily II DNA or RNA helicase
MIEEMRRGFETAYIDGSVVSNESFRPQFVSNNYREGKKVISSIENELRVCDSFQISVAFITRSGITPLLSILKELEEKNIPGQILTTDYLNFSEPKALETIHQLKNIELKMYHVQDGKEGFHTKGYIFKKEEIYRIIIGSANLTGSALTKNIEWNTKLVSTKDGEMTKQIIEEFNCLWNSQDSLSFEDFIENYKEKYQIISKQRQIAKAEELVSLEKYKLEPNSMQVGFISNLKKILEKNETEGNMKTRALLISATGTGKTYASAFAMRELGFKKVLFLVHREQILKQARNSYKKVLPSTVSTGLLSGNHKDYHADYLFSTVQTMSRDEILNKFDINRFDCIVIDETHKAGAPTYQKIMEYFKPRLFLGMTASPERTDGFDIYKLFDHNIAYEIRLNQALEEDLLCPFHYFGISDLTIDGELIDDNTAFNKLTSKSRVDHILEQANYYGHSGNRVKGLIFCSRNEEAKQLSVEFNSRGLNTVALSGENSEEEREAAVARLEMDNFEENGHKALDYIFTVDIFNEGVDIPEVNQVIMLRPTQSAIIFVQQLGRGLRKADNKEYVVVLDFIGNYQNNFLIPIALSGDRSYNKDTIRKYVREGSRVIPGCSTIHFDEITRKQIYESIDKMTTKKKMLSEKYYQMKYKLGRIPSVLDFYEHGEVDPMLFIKYSGSYYEFVKSVDKDYSINFNKEQVDTISFISNLIVDGKRIHELLMLKAIIEKGNIEKSDFIKNLEAQNEKFKEADYESALRIITGEFLSGSDKKNFKDVDFVDMKTFNKDYLKRETAFYNILHDLFFKKELENLIEYGFRRYEDIYKNHDDNNLVLYEKYSRKDVCRLMNWDKDESSTMYGYRIKHNTCPIFITYEKKDDISESTKYEDQFINQRIFSWMTRSRVTLEKDEAQSIINYKDNNLKICLFIKKSDGEGSDFYYMGNVKPIDWQQKTIKNDKGQDLPIVNFLFSLDREVREDIYEYLIS